MKMKTILIIAIRRRLLLGQSLQTHEVNIYSLCQPFLIESFLTAFTEETGIETKVLYSKNGLAQPVMAANVQAARKVLIRVDPPRSSRSDPY